MNFTVILYRIDRYKTRNDDVYGEALEGGINFLAPVEVKGLVQNFSSNRRLFGWSVELNKMSQVI
jgi:hypothetical protein